MAKNTTPAATTPQTDTSAPATPAADLGAQALAKMQTLFKPERWEKILRQSRIVAGLDEKELQALCMQMLATRNARHPDNAAAAEAAAANGLLIALNSTLNADDVGRYEAALKGLTYVPAAPVPAPVPVPAAT